MTASDTMVPERAWQDVLRPCTGAVAEEYCQRKLRTRGFRSQIDLYRANGAVFFGEAENTA